MWIIRVKLQEGFVILSVNAPLSFLMMRQLRFILHFSLAGFEKNKIKKLSIIPGKACAVLSSSATDDLTTTAFSGKPRQLKPFPGSQALSRLI